MYIEIIILNEINQIHKLHKINVNICIANIQNNREEDQMHEEEREKS